MEASAAPARTADPGRRPRLASPRLLRLASDERLVAHVRAGSQAAFEVLYDRHHRGILSFCRHMLGSREEAEDAVQHTFMAAYRDLAGSDKQIQLRAWLYAIARNRCFSVLRARRERPSDDLVEPVTEGLATEVQRRADLQDLLRDLADLPEDQRAALVLSELGDLPHDEIGAVLGCPREKVKALVFQARSSLQQSREARDTSCQEIREMLSTLSGGALRRTALRRHLKDCAGCREFEAEVKRQRRAMAVVLPVLPTLGLKESALAAAFGAKGAAAGAAGAAALAGGAAGGVATAGGTSALVAKVLVVAAVASGGSVAGYEAVSGGGDALRDARDGQKAGGSAGGGSGVPAVAPGEEAREERTEKAEEDRPVRRRRGHDDRGREFAKTRGKGKKHGLLGTQPGKEAKEERVEARKERAAAREEARSRRRARRPAQRPTRQRAESRRPDAIERPEPTRRPEKDPEPTPTPTPVPTPTPTPTPEQQSADPDTP